MNRNLLTALSISLALASGVARADDQTAAKNTSANPNAAATNVTAQDLNQNIGTYVGKQVALSGRIDRVLGNGSFIVSDFSNAKNPANRVLVFTSAASSQTDSKMLSHDKQPAKQQGGISAPQFKEGDAIQLNGRAEEFSVSNEVDTVSPKSDSETINESMASVPVIVVQPGSISRS